MVEFDVAEAVVLKCVAHNFYIAVVQIEVVASVKGHVGPDSDGVFVRSEHEEVSLDLPAQFGCISSHNLCLVLLPLLLFRLNWSESLVHCRRLCRDDLLMLLRDC